jgi:hypothetical protein
MACKKQFNNMFLVEKLSKLWTNEKYKPHVSSVMVDIEISKLSESMQEAETRKEIYQLKAQIAQVREEKDNAMKKFSRDMEFLGNKLRILERQKPERKAFIMPCSYNECKGLLSTQYKCGICQRFTCKDCQEPNESEHKCNPDNVATAEAIKNETRPCPSCRTRIYKIEGCDQMWCTSCKTPFSWTSGTIVPAGQRIHNPHAIEFMKQNGVNLRAPGDLQCGGIITWQQYRTLEQNMINMEKLFFSLTNNNIQKANAIFAQKMTAFKFDFLNPDGYNIFKNIFSNLYTAYIIINEVSVNKLRESREVSQAHHDFNEDRVQYIIGKIDKNAFAARIKRHNQNKNVQLELSFVWEIISNFGIDMFNDLYNSSTNSTITIEHALAFFNKVFQKLNEFNALIKYVNLQLANVSVANSCTVHIIDYNFNSSNPFYYSLTYIQHGNNRNWTYYGSEPRYLFKSQTFTNTTLKKMNL